MEKHFQSTGLPIFHTLRFNNTNLYKRLVVIGGTVALVLLSYKAAEFKLDHESEDAMLAMDLKGSSHLLGKKGLNRYGQLVRRDTTAQCSVGVPGATVYHDWSNHAVCSQNVILHTNCVPICQDSYNTCDGCAALNQDHLDQMTTAQQHCDDKAAKVCALVTKANGQYDYAAFSSCCLPPVGADACFCTEQVTAAPSCFAYGSCLDTCTSAPPTRQTCTGTMTTTTIAPLACATGYTHNDYFDTCDANFPQSGDWDVGPSCLAQPDPTNPRFPVTLIPNMLTEGLTPSDCFNACLDDGTGNAYEICAISGDTCYAGFTRSGLDEVPTDDCANKICDTMANTFCAGDGYALFWEQGL